MTVGTDTQYAGTLRSATTLTLQQVPTQGNLLVLFVYSTIANQTITLSDPNWTQIDTITGTQGSLWIFTRPVQPGDTTTSSIGTLGFGSYSSNDGGYWITEQSGVNVSSAVDGHATNSPVWSACTTSSITPSVSNSYALAFFGCLGTGQTFNGVSAGWTGVEAVSASHSQNYACTYSSTVTGSISCTATLPGSPSHPIYAGIVTLAPPTSGGATSSGQATLSLTENFAQTVTDQGGTAISAALGHAQRSNTGAQSTLGLVAGGSQKNVKVSSGAATLAPAVTYAEMPRAGARTQVSPTAQGYQAPRTGKNASLALTARGSAIEIEYNRTLLTLAASGSQSPLSRGIVILTPIPEHGQRVTAADGTSLSLAAAGAENAITNLGSAGNALLVLKGSGQQQAQNSGSTGLSFSYTAQSVFVTVPVWRPRVESINSKIQRLMGKGARYVGTLFDVYRLNAAGPSNGSILAPQNKIFSRVKFRMVIDNIGWTVEQTKIYEMVYLGMGDVRKLEIGDILVDTEKVDGAMYALADMRPINPNVFVRVDVGGTLTRPAGKQVAPNTSQPLQGRIGYQGLGKPTEQICVLNNGSYDFVPSGVPATIPIGIQPYKRLGPMPKFGNAPSFTHRNEVFAYCPLLPGIQIQPGDTINAQNGDRYQIHTVTPFTVGMQGYLMIAESLLI